MDKYLFGVISYNTVFTVTTSYLVFFLGVYFQKKIELYKRRKNCKSVKENFLHLVQALPEKYISPNIMQLREFYLNHDIDTRVTEIPPITTSGDLERISDYSSNELFIAFRTLTKGGFEKELHNILGYVDYLKEQKKIIKRYHTAIFIRNNELINEIYILVEEYLDLISSSIQEIKKSDKNFEQNEFCTYIDDMLSNYYVAPDRDNTISYLYGQLLSPIQVELVNKGYYKHIREAEMITRLGKKITIRYTRLKYETESIKKQYIQFCDETSILLKEFQKCSDRLSTLK
ncbi:MAG: hypothetical protein WBH98_02990 [Bacteroidales bacterium]